MKNLLLFSVLLTVAAAPAAAQGLPEVLDPVVNFDYVAAAPAEAVKLRWRILNAGTAAFTATGGQSSSAALSARWRNTPIEPGEYLLVEGSFDPAKHAPGHVAEQLLLKTDSGAPLRLTAVGNILKVNEAAPAPARAPAPATTDGKSYGYVTGMATEAIAPAFKSAGKFSEGRAFVELPEGRGYINTKGEFVTEAKYKWCYRFREGLAVVKDAAGKYGAIDLSGKEIIACQYDDVNKGYFEDGTLGVVKDGHGLLIDGYGRDLGLTKDPAIQDITPLHHGVALFKKDNKWGLLNAKGEVLLPPTYDGQKDGFCNGRALVSKDKLLGYIDLTGHEVVPCTLSNALPFTEGKGVGRAGEGNYQVFDGTGKVLFEAATGKFGELFSFHDGRARLVAGPDADFKVGYLDATGKVLLPPTASSAQDFSDGYAVVIDGSDTSFFGWDAKVLFPFDFANLGDMAVYEGAYGLAAARANNARPSLSASGLARRPPNESVIAPAEGAAVLAAVVQPGFRLSGLPALAGQTPPPLGGAPAAGAPPVASKVAAKPAAKPAVKPAVRK